MHKHCPDLVFLMETKAKYVYMDKLQRKFNFQYMHLISPVGKAGGLALLWSNPSHVQTLHVFNNMIDVRILHPSNLAWWQFSGVYGNPNPT